MLTTEQSRNLTRIRAELREGLSGQFYPEVRARIYKEDALILLGMVDTLLSEPHPSASLDALLRDHTPWLQSAYGREDEKHSLTAAIRILNAARVDANNGDRQGAGELCGEALLDILDYCRRVEVSPTVELEKAFRFRKEAYPANTDPLGPGKD